MNSGSSLPSVAVLMSGGVDSSVAAALLVRAGHQVVGFTLKLWDAENDQHARNLCCTTVMARDAAHVCSILEIPHYTLDLRDQFRREVIERFERDYLLGLTPNPCVHCNSRVKWGTVWQKARTIGLERIATGHYARILPGADGFRRLRRGLDTEKDQSYFLWEIPRELLDVTIFPLGELTKPEVRALAHDFGLPVAEKEESQDVCFVPPADYRGWLQSRRPELDEGAFAGEMVNGAGYVIGHHDGYPFFTVGQRKGLGLGRYGRKLFVTRIEPGSRRVFVGSEGELARREFEIGSVNFLIPPVCNREELRGGGHSERSEKPPPPLAGDPPLPLPPLVGGRPLPPPLAGGTKEGCDEGGEILHFVQNDEFVVKIRYRDPGAPVSVTRLGDRLRLTAFDQLRAVTPGQSAVIYAGDDVVAGGIIL